MTIKDTVAGKRQIRVVPVQGQANKRSMSSATENNKELRSYRSCRAVVSDDEGQRL
jgi:hypothetical protein